MIIKPDYNIFLSDYLNLAHNDFVSKYSKYNIDLPSEDEFLSYLIQNNKLDCMIDTAEQTSTDKTLFLIKVEPHKNYEVYSLFRGIKVSEQSFNNIRPAIFEKLSRILGELWANRR